MRQRHTSYYHIISDLFPSCIRLVILQMQLILESRSTMGKSLESRCNGGDGQPTMPPPPPLKTAILKGSCLAGWLDVRSKESLRFVNEEDPAIRLAIVKQSIHPDSWAGLHAFCPPFLSLSLILHCSQSVIFKLSFASVSLRSSFLGGEG